MLLLLKTHSPISMSSENRVFSSAFCFKIFKCQRFSLRFWNFSNCNKIIPDFFKVDISFKDNVNYDYKMKILVFVNAKPLP